MPRKGQKGQDHPAFAVLAETRAAKAVELRSLRFTYARIGRELGITEEGARRAVIRGLKDTSSPIEETVEEALSLELMRLDSMLLMCWPAAMRGDLKAVDRVLRIEEQRARLLGLYRRSRRLEDGACLTPSGVQGLNGQIVELLFELIRRGGPEFKAQLLDMINAL